VLAVVAAERASFMLTDEGSRRKFCAVAKADCVCWIEGGAVGWSAVGVLELLLLSMREKRDCSSDMVLVLVPVVGFVGWAGSLLQGLSVVGVLVLLEFDRPIPNAGTLTPARLRLLTAEVFNVLNVEDLAGASLVTAS
jgi:hypothetical protein